MKKGLTIFLQVVVVLIAIFALAFMLIEPNFEGRNVNSKLFEVYFKDPFLAYAYLSSILFFVALHRAFKVLGYIRENKIFSQATTKALLTIKYCMISLVALIAGAEVCLFILERGKDDIAGGVAMGVFLILIFSIVSVVAGVYERKVKNTIGGVKTNLPD